jgi:hypothetical protein
VCSQYKVAKFPLIYLILFCKSECPDHVGSYVSGGMVSGRVAYARQVEEQGLDERVPSPLVWGLGMRIKSSPVKHVLRNLTRDGKWKIWGEY